MVGREVCGLTRREDALIWDRPRVVYLSMYFSILLLNPLFPLDRGRTIDFERMPSLHNGIISKICGAEMIPSLRNDSISSKWNFEEMETFRKEGISSICWMARRVCTEKFRDEEWLLQGYLAHKKQPPPRTLQQAYA